MIDKIEQFLKTFKPKFGNENHIRILDTYKRVKKLRVLIDKNKISTRAQRTELEKKETHLEWLLSTEK